MPYAKEELPPTSRLRWIDRWVDCRVQIYFYCWTGSIFSDLFFNESCVLKNFIFLLFSNTHLPQKTRDRPRKQRGASLTPYARKRRTGFKRGTAAQSLIDLQGTCEELPSTKGDVQACVLAGVCLLNESSVLKNFYSLLPS